MGRFVSSITFDHNENFSCVFRNWKSTVEHQRFLHGYSLSIKIIFESKGLDDSNQNLNPDFINKIKAYLTDTFYYTTIISEDDPTLPYFNLLNRFGVIKLRTLPDVSLEKFSQQIYTAIAALMVEKNLDRLILKTVEVREHQGASSLYIE